MAQPPDKLKAVQGQTHHLIDVMKYNMDKAIQRGESLEKTDEAAQRLEHSASRFQKSAKALKCEYLVRNWKLVTLVTVIVLCGILLFLAATGAFR